MMNLKYQLTVKILQQLNDTEKPAIDDLFLTVWKNTSHANGLALTKTGLNYLVDLLNLEQWKFSIPDITSGDVVMMDRYMIYPYYFVSQKTNTHKNLIIFDESTATQLLLYNNNLRLLLSAYDNDSDIPVIKHQK